MVAVEEIRGYFIPRFLRKPDFSKGIVVEVPGIGVLGVREFLFVEIIELTFECLGPHSEAHRPVRREGFVGSIDSGSIFYFGVFADRLLGHYRIFARYDHSFGHG